jgi:hypothetical protein
MAMRKGRKEEIKALLKESRKSPSLLFLAVPERLSLV